MIKNEALPLLFLWVFWLFLNRINISQIPNVERYDGVHLNLDWTDIAYQLCGIYGKKEWEAKEKCLHKVGFKCRISSGYAWIYI